jgi:hypothetical protein
MRFKLMAGKHIGTDGKVYRPGAVVESDEDLTKKWQNKFERALPQESGVRRSKNAGNPTEMVPEEEVDDRKFQETENSDKDTTDRSFVGAKDKVKKAEDDLAAAQERLKEAKARAASAKKAASEAEEEASAEAEAPEGDSNQESPAPVTSSLGDEDVTDDFPEARKNGLLVFKKGRDHFVTETEDPNKAINEEGPLKHGAVRTFIKNYLK